MKSREREKESKGHALYGRKNSYVQVHSSSPAKCVKSNSDAEEAIRRDQESQSEEIGPQIKENVIESSRAPTKTPEEKEYKSEWRLRYEAAKEHIKAVKRDENYGQRNYGEEDDQDRSEWKIWHGKKSSGGRDQGRSKFHGEKMETKKVKIFRGKEVRFEDLITIFVDGLHPMIDASWLRFIFKDYGRVMDAFVPSKKREGVMHRFGFIRYRTKIEAMEAIKHLNGTRRHGYIFKVKLADYTWKRNRDTGDLSIKDKDSVKKVWSVKMEGRSYKRCGYE